MGHESQKELTEEELIANELKQFDDLIRKKKELKDNLDMLRN